jgi:hypothetical protein
MCTVKTPKVSTPVAQAAEKKDPIYMRNAYLDGLGMGAESSGRSSLRINPGSSRITRPTNVPVTALPSMGARPAYRNPGLYMGVM